MEIESPATTSHRRVGRFPSVDSPPLLTRSTSEYLIYWSYPRPESWHPVRRIAARVLVLTYLGIYPALAGNQVLLRLLNPSDGTPQAIAADGAGHLFVLSAPPGTPGPEVRVVKLDLAGIRLASIDLPQVVSSTAASTDAQGNLIVAGADSSFRGAS